VDESTRERYADLLWAQPDWLLSARAWIEQHARVAGEIEQIHLRPWSTVLRAPTPEGDLFLKAASTSGAFEPALTLLLAERMPARIAQPVAVDLERGWMLMRDAGTRLRELVHSVAELHHWTTLLPAYAELQIELAPEADELLGLGVPDRRLAKIPGLLATLLEDTEALELDLVDGLTSAELARMREELPAITEMCAELAVFGIPESIQHDDFHDGNISVRDGTHVFFDWGDSCVSHPFHTLVVTLRAVAMRFDLDPGGAELLRLRDAYLEPFGSLTEPAALREAFDLAYRLGTIGRTLAWYSYVREPDLREWSELAGRVPYGLQRFLEHGPIGSWRWE
jgi:Phosphotransferase enzyme family